jgi:hypothetical protein
MYRRRGSIGDEWVTYTEEPAHYPTARWVQERLRDNGGAVALRASGMPMRLAAVRAGAGRGILPRLKTALTQILCSRLTSSRAPVEIFRHSRPTAERGIDFLLTVLLGENNEDLVSTLLGFP